MCAPVGVCACVATLLRVSVLSHDNEAIEQKWAGVQICIGVPTMESGMGNLGRGLHFSGNNGKIPFPHVRHASAAV